MSEIKKKKSVFAKIVIAILIVLFLVILLVGALFIYSSVDKKKTISVMPHDYSVYLHMDSVWESVEPMLDLQAVDMFLVNPELASVRGLLMQLRASEWRNNKFLAFLAAKPVDCSLYQMGTGEEQTQNILACIDLGALSAVTRFAKYYYKLFKVEKLSYDEGMFIFDNNDSSFYIKPEKNLVIFSNNKELLQRSLEKNYNDYSKEDLEIITKKTNEPIRVIVNARKFLDSMAEDNKIIEQLSKTINPESLSSVSFKITDNDIKLNASIPFEQVEDENFSLTPILQKNSTTPAIISRLKENVQYYTLINAGTFQELKDSFMPLFVENADVLWEKYNRLAKSVLKISIEDLLFSWSGKEIAVFGIENKNDPVFAIQVTDEKQRQKVFEKFTSSMFINNNSSLIVDGVRIPCLELPDFLQELLGMFDVSLPKPYYLVQDGYIYFSVSEENLSEIYKASNQIDKITGDENWGVVSKGLSTNATVSLYYNLERSVPFFLRSKASLANVLSLYSLGRADFGIKDSQITIQLSAISKDSIKNDGIPGFPMDLEGKPDGDLQLENLNKKAKTNALYWVENKNTAVSMEIPSTKITRVNMNDTIFMCPFTNETENKVWCVTAHGEIYQLNRSLETIEGFPVMINDNISVKPGVAKNGLYIISDNGNLFFVDNDGNIRQITLELFGSAKSTPSIYEYDKNRNIVAIYDKSFFGKIIVIQDWDDSKTVSFDVPGISFGSPVFISQKNKLPYMGFVLQKGDFYLWNLETQESSVVTLGKLYQENAVNIDEFSYVVSTEGVITRISLTGETLDVQIPSVTCNDVFITTIDNLLYVCPDGNIVYGFDKNLEMLYPFPITGWGRPVFADINGDKIEDCFTLSVDKKLYVKNLRG